MKQIRHFCEWDVPRFISLKTFKKMKLTFILLILTVVQALGSESYSQTTKISLNLENATIAEVLEQIENQSDFNFLYSPRLIDVDKRVTVVAKDKQINEVLSSIFGEEVSRIIVNEHQVVLSPNNTAIQKKKITGTVVDEAGITMPGVNVMVEGTTNGTITDADGKFSIDISAENSILVFSFIGYEAQKISAEGKTAIDVSMKPALTGLDEVVVVGYGVQKKVNLTGAVAAINGEEMSKRPVVNVTQSLQGVIPGLFASVPTSGGTPGENYNLNIRGQGNLSGSDAPYVLVDGVEMGLADVNPNDIESISVLKDAAAASIYGARAAYGVILVTTKKGQEGKMKVSYQGTVGWTTPTNLPEMANGFEFAKFFNQGCINAGQTPQYSADQLALLEQYVNDPKNINSWPGVTGNNSTSIIYENNSLGVGSTDWFKFHYKDFAFKQDHNISLSGGTKAVQYYASAGFYDEGGLLQYADINYKRYNFNGSISSQITDWLKFKTNTKFSLSENKSPFGEGAIDESLFYHGLARFRATTSPYDLNGNFSELSQVPYLQSGTYAETVNSTALITGGFEAQPLKDWRIFLDYTFKKGTNDYESFATPAQFTGIDGTTYTQNTRTELGIPDASSFLRSMANNNYQTLSLYSNYSFKAGTKHNFALVGGYQEEYNRYSYLYDKVTGLISTSNPGINLATGDKTSSEARTGWATRGFFGRINYDFDGKYLLEFNGRYDGSSRFAKENRWGFFPSVSAGWNIARENFMSPLNKVVNNLKLRASYGLLGNQSGADLYTFAQTMTTSTQGDWYFADGRNMIIWGPEPFDSNVTWEKVESMNAGLDYGFLEGRLSGTFDIFQRTTKDMLGPNVDVADMYGASAPNTNNAVMRSRGWEFTISYRGKINDNIDYTVGGMISDAQSEVLEYSNPTKTNPSDNWYVGKKVGEIWGYKSSGIIQSQAEADDYNTNYNLAYLTSRAFTPGDLKFLDLNGDNAINNGTNVLGNMGDKAIIGNTTPRYQYAINGSLTYKELTISMLWQGVGKRDYNPAGSNYFSGAQSYAQVTVFKEHLDYWSEDNTDAYFAKPYVSGFGNIGTFTAKTTNTTSDYYLQNAAYIRLKNLTINYNLPDAWIKKVNLSKASVFVSGENLLTFTDMIGFFDPELVFISLSGGKNYPLTKVFSVGLILNL